MLLETIRLHNGNLQNLFWHNRRSNAARSILYKIHEKWNLKELIHIPDFAKSGVWKCRALYNEKIQKVDFQPYTIKKINSVQIVHADSFDYSFKFVERSFFQKIKTSSSSDDVLIIKNGLVTDMSYANVVFYDGKKWWTPDSPLLEGTRRAQLLARKRIFLRKIHVSDLDKFVGFRPINAMLQFGRTEMIPIKSLNLDKN